MVAFPSLAHIKLTSPGSFQITDALGNPQKSAPCGGAGTASGIVTTVEAGAQLTVTWSETILHPGHFRIGVATDQAHFVTPTPVLDNGGTNCASAPIETTPAYPTLVDGLFVHTTAAPNNSYSTTITVPMMSCDNCTLQLMQFMASHAPPCFYYQCATLKIVMPDAGVGDAGTDDAGSDAGAGVDAGSDAGSPTDAGPAESDAGLDEHMHPPALPLGCGCNAGPFSVLLLLVPLLFWRRRR